jgi:hypothetical protein
MIVWRSLKKYNGELLLQDDNGVFWQDGMVEILDQDAAATYKLYEETPVSVTIRISQGLCAVIDDHATEQHRSRSGQIACILAEEYSK